MLLADCTFNFAFFAGLRFGALEGQEGRPSEHERLNSPSGFSDSLN